MAADAALGFSWMNAINYLSNFPHFAFALRFVYMSLLPQLAFVIVLLSFFRLEGDLHRFLMVFFLSMAATTGVWWLIPSVGPAAYAMVSEAAQHKVSLVANAEYGEKMWRYATEGNLLISRSTMAGVVAFPSMHIVLTCMVLWFTLKTYMFYPLLVLNFLMPVATVLQGGHHIMDIFGGFLVFFFCVKLANFLIPKQDHAPAARH
ncbi:MAG: phosphatase PAP2 family protein [Rhodoferax sp.]|nr:phosphatase PAP2 family protein [Pseudorhodobacter sp.]